MPPRAAQGRDRAAGLLHTLRVRVRLRTRLRHAAQAWRHRFPRRLPRWSAELPLPATPTTEVVTASDGVVLVTPAAASPRGRRRHGPPLPLAELVLPEGDEQWQVRRSGDSVTVVAGRVGAALDSRQSAVLAQLAAVTWAGAASAPPERLARVLVPLAMTGVVLHARQPPPGVAAELAEVIAAPLPARDADAMEWELRSVQQRRLAIREHTAGLARTRPPTVSALLVTKRPQLVAHAVAVLAGQTYPELEIVVAVHGSPAPSDLSAGDRPLRIVEVPASQVLGEALAAATGAATGELVTKVDDDDRYGPEHIWDLVLARHYSNATVVGKGAEFVYLEPDEMTVRRRMAAEAETDTVAGGTIALTRAELAASGGWPAVPHSVDRALLDQIIAGGGSVYRTHPLGFIYTRHGAGHTWDPGLEYFKRDPLRTWPGLPAYAEFGTGPAR